MQSTLTLTDGSTPNVFTYRQTDSSGTHTWTGVSDNGDLAGVPFAERKSTKTRANIVSRNFKVVYPVYNTATGKYEGSIQGRVVLNAPSTTSLDLCKDVLAKLVSAFDPATNGQQIDDFLYGY